MQWVKYLSCCLVAKLLIYLCFDFHPIRKEYKTYGAGTKGFGVTARYWGQNGTTHYQVRR